MRSFKTSGFHSAVSTLLRTTSLDSATRYWRLTTHSCCDDDTTKYVAKEIPQDFAIRTNIYRRIGDFAHIRTPLDTVPEHRMCIFKYLDQNLLRLVQRDLPLMSIKRILKCALRGLALLHEKDVVHNDVKPNNILVQTQESNAGLKVEQVQLADLEDAAHVAPGGALKGAQLGNIMWRSPESHAMGPMQKPSDMFSFGIVCVYAMIQGVVFGVDKHELTAGVDEFAIVIERQISSFADEDGFQAFLSYIGEDSPWHEIFQLLKRGFGAEQPREPFELWQGDVMKNENFKSLVSGLTNFDPNKRLTAQEALSHEWFADV